MSEPFYVNKLYPLQDAVLKSIGSINNGFYLTGGTALSRLYLKHRYSDDSDDILNARANSVFPALTNDHGTP
jgi:predicted nucleotidyltransferase component of viral defense system